MSSGSPVVKYDYNLKSISASNALDLSTSYRPELGIDLARDIYIDTLPYGASGFKKSSSPLGLTNAWEIRREQANIVREDHYWYSIIQNHVQLLDARTQSNQNQIRSEIKSLSSKVDDLAKILESSLGSTQKEENTSEDSILVLSITEENLLRAHENGQLTQLLNLIADEAITFSPATKFAQDALSNSNNALRAAAARALSVTDPEVALKILPDAIAKEQNRFVAAVLRGALRAAAA